jgi:hypothetical protein
VAGFLRLNVVQRVEPPELPAVTGSDDGTAIVNGRHAQLPAGMLVTEFVASAALAVIAKLRQDGEHTLAAPFAHQLAGAQRPTARSPKSESTPKPDAGGVRVGSESPSQATRPTTTNKEPNNRTRTMRTSRGPSALDETTLVGLRSGSKAAR